MHRRNPLKWLARRPRRLSARRTQLRVESLEGRTLLSYKPYLYVASFDTNSIERFDERTGEPAPGPLAPPKDPRATFVPRGLGGLSHPLGILVGPYDGNLYVSNLDTNQVLVFDGDTGLFLRVFVDDPDLRDPSGIIFGPDRKFYVSS